MANRSFGKHRDVGSAAADIDQHDPQFTLIRRQYRIRRRHRLQNQIRYLQAATTHALDDVLYCRHGTGNDMHFDFQPDTAHPDGFTYVFLVVDDEFLRHGMQQLLVGRDVDCLGGFDNARDVSGADFLILDCHHAAGIETADVATGNPGIDIANLAVGHQFSLFQGALNRLDGGLDINHHSLLESLGFGLAQADHLVATVLQYLRHHGHHFRGADVEADDQIFGVFCHIVPLIFSFHSMQPVPIHRPSMPDHLDNACQHLRSCPANAPAIADKPPPVAQYVP